MLGRQIVDFLVDPTAYDSIGASRPKGILLVGPPGTGTPSIIFVCFARAVPRLRPHPPAGISHT